MLSVSASEAREEVARLLASAIFGRAPKLSRFLRYISEQALAGKGDALKEYIVGVEVFERGEAFDPRIDTIVRVQARNLRNRLQEYYRDEGAGSPIRMEIPKGSYQPVFVRVAFSGSPFDGTPSAVRTGSLEREEGLQTSTIPAQREDPRSVPEPSLIGPRAARFFVGREAEVDKLRDALERAAGGESLVVGVAGEAGLGKTALVETFLEQTSSVLASPRVARGGCSERLAGTEAFLPFFDAIEDLVSRHCSLASLLRHVAPWWYVQIATSASADRRDAHIFDEIRNATQERVKRELVAFLREASAEQAVLIVIEDFHWADLSSVDLVAYLAARFEQLRLLFVTTYRPEEMAASDHPFLKIRCDLLSRGRCEEIELPALARSDIDQYLELCYPGHALPPELSSLLFEQTEGSPLFFTDLIRDLQAREVISKQTETWRLAQPVSDLKLEMPISIEAMIQRKVDALSEDDCKLLEAASVQGFSFDSAVLAESTRLDEEELEDRLQKLDGVHRFLQFLEEAEYPDRTPTLRYRFGHVLYQNHLYGALTRARRIRLSRATAEALERFHGEKTEEVAATLASLYEKARDPQKAARYQTRAAENAVNVFAFQEAIILARHGLELLESLQNGPERDRLEISCHAAIGASLNATRGYADEGVGRAYSRIRELARRGAFDERIVMAVGGLGTHYIVTCQLDKGLELGEELLQDVKTRGAAGRALMVALNRVGVVHQFRGSFPAAQKKLAEIPRSSGALSGEFGASVTNLDFLVTSLGHLALNSWVLGFPRQALAHSRAAAERAREMKHPFVLTHYLAFGCFLYEGLRDPEKVVELADENIAVSRDNGYRLNIGWASASKGWATARLGDPTQGLELMLEGLRIWRGSGMVAMVPYWHSLLCEVYLQLGKPERGLPLLQESLELIERTNHRFHESETYRMRAELTLPAGGDADAAEADYRKAVEVARRQQAKSFELRASLGLSRLWYDQGRGGDARELLLKT